MLCVPTYVAPSRIAGVGLFSASTLSEGTRIWEFTDGVDWKIRPSDLVSFPEPFQGWLRHYLFLDEDGVYVLCGDNAKFMNHASSPNCSDKDTRFTVTLRRIEAGEELTCDYLEFDGESRQLGLPWAIELPEVGMGR
jgi:SET domain-containing protein